MKNNLFFKSTLILIIGGGLSKILGMITKIILVRTIGVDGVSLHMLIMPTFLLFITLSQFGLPITISKLVSEDKVNNKRLVLSTLVISILFNLFLIVLIILIAPYLANNLLKNKDAYLPILCIGSTLPFMSITSIIRGYFFGKQNMYPHVISNIFEQVIRLLLIIFITPYLLKYSISIAVTGLILYNIISEGLSIFILYFYLPKKVTIRKKDLIPQKVMVKEVLDISLPTTSSKIIGSISYFIEPIILIQILTYTGYSTTFITNEYGIISGFVIQTLLLPSFFTLAISQALIPVISKNYALGNKVYIKKKIKQATLFSFGIGFIITSILLINPSFFLNILYNTTKGSNYIYVVAPFFLIFYFQGPLTSSLQAMNKSKQAFLITLKGIIIKTMLLITLSFFKLGLYPLIISTIINVIYVTFNYYKLVKKTLN